MVVSFRAFVAGVVGAALLILTLFSSPQARAEAPPRIYQIYLVRKGDTLAGVAKRFGVSVRAIRKANGLRSSRIRPGRRLKIPVRKAPRTNAACGREYRVRQGDDIRRIARRCGIAARALRLVNDLRPGQRLRPGQILRIPATSQHTYLPPPTY